MKYIIAFALVASGVVFLYGCKETTGPSAPTVEFYSILRSPIVRQNIQSDAKANTTLDLAVVDSLRIERVRILVRRLKLHVAEDDSSYINIKTDAFIITFTPQALSLTSAIIPAGRYRSIKFEFHRLTDDEMERYLYTPAFADFITPDRYSIIVDGRIWRNGYDTTFTYQSQVTANVSLPFDLPIEVHDGMLFALLVEFDPSRVFSAGGKVVDPRVPSNKSDIEKNIRLAFKAMKL